MITKLLFLKSTLDLNHFKLYSLFHFLIRLICNIRVMCARTRVCVIYVDCSYTNYHI